MSKNSEKKIVHNAYVPGRFDQAITLIFFFSSMLWMAAKIDLHQTFLDFLKISLAARVETVVELRPLSILLKFTP